MADVFISYARQDKTRVAPLVAAIEASGWSVWWDPEICPGQEFDRQIVAELKIATAVLVVWTPNSVESRWVRGEAREGALAALSSAAPLLSAANSTACGFSAAQLGATEALQRGLADAIAEPGEALGAAIADAEVLAAGPPLALAGIKSMLSRWQASPEELLDAEIELGAALMDTDDFAEGTAAFAQRRTPVFRGR